MAKYLAMILVSACKRIMRSARRRVFLILASVTTLVVALFATAQVADLAPIFVQGETPSFRYSAKSHRSGNLEVVISVNFDDPATLQKYIQANRQRGQELVKKGQVPIPVRITFARPLPLDETRKLAQETSLDVTSFAMVGRSSTRPDSKGSHIEFGPLSRDVQTRQKIDPTGGGEELILSGVMVLYGEMRDVMGLSRLLNDERVYLADTSEVEVRQVLEERHAPLINGRQLTVSIPSPFWNMSR